jgi:hypothetical protein
MRPVPASPAITRPLLPFVRSSEGPVRALMASAEREGKRTLRFRYELDADLSAVRIPATRAPRQADELWKHTCFEAFIACSPRISAYCELNFSPSSEWAAYSFESYRQGMTPVELLVAPRIDVVRAGSQLLVDARIDVRELLPEHWQAPDTKFSMALSAVIEDGSGRISYWALKHAPDKPDFHHAAGFILEV